MEVRRRAASSVVGVTPTPSETSAEDVHHNSTTSLGTAEAIVPGSSPHPSEEGILPEEGPEAVGGCTRFVRAFRGLWKTTTLEGASMEEDSDFYVSILLRELFTYLPFLVALCIMGYCTLQPGMFYLTKAMQAVFVDAPEFTEITNTNEFWDYMEGPFLSTLHKEKNYDQSEVHHTEFGYILFENKLLGRPRLRQLRVRNGTCSMHSLFVDHIETCYGDYSLENEENINYWSGEIHSGWAYLNASVLNGHDTVGKLATYGGGGYVQELDETSAMSGAILAHLKEHLWIDRGTRAVIVDFTVYNGNLNVFTLVKFLFEFPPTGGVVAIFRFKSQKLLRYVTPLDYFVMACEGIIILFIIYNIIEEVLEFRTLGWDYFFDLWAAIDILVILLSATCIAINLYRTFSVNTKLEDILKHRREYGNFEAISFWQDKLNDIIAVTLFIAWFKVFKYLGFNQTMAELQGTMISCMKDIMGFTVMFTIVFFSFAIWGVAAFGAQLEDFMTFTMANFTLFRIILGDFDFDALTAASRTIGPIFFLLYIFAFTFILLNMFMAIFFDTYADVKEELDEEEDKFDITEYFGKGMDKVIVKLNVQREKIEDIRYALREADTNGDNFIDFEEWRFQMKMKGHSAAEAEALFAKYDKDGDRLLNSKEKRKMMADLEEEEDDVKEEMDNLAMVKKQQEALMSKVYLKNEGSDGEESESEKEEDEDESSDSESEEDRLVEYEEYNELEDRVGNCEDGIQTIVKRVDEVLLKLKDMDMTKSERRDNMENYVQSIAGMMQNSTEWFEWFGEEEFSQIISRQPSQAALHHQSRVSGTVPLYPVLEKDIEQGVG